MDAEMQGWSISWLVAACIEASFFFLFIEGLVAVLSVVQFCCSFVERVPHHEYFVSNSS